MGRPPPPLLFLLLLLASASSLLVLVSLFPPAGSMQCWFGDDYEKENVSCPVLADPNLLRKLRSSPAYLRMMAVWGNSDPGRRENHWCGVITNNNTLDHLHLCVGTDDPRFPPDIGDNCTLLGSVHVLCKCNTSESSATICNENTLYAGPGASAPMKPVLNLQKIDPNDVYYGGTVEIYKLGWQGAGADRVVAPAFLAYLMWIFLCVVNAGN